MFMLILKITLWIFPNEIKIVLFPVSNVQIFLPMVNFRLEIQAC